MSIAVVCTALLALLVFGLGFLVSMNRSKRMIGYDPDPTDKLYKYVRAHGNATEYAPIFAVLFLFLSSREPSTWVLVSIVVATVARYAHAVGMIAFPTLAKPNPLRFSGALFTYLAGFALAVATFLEAGA